MHGLLKELNFSLPEHVVEDGGGREGRTRKWVREPVAEVSRSKIMKNFVCRLNERGLCHEGLGGGNHCRSDRLIANIVLAPVPEAGRGGWSK